MKDQQFMALANPPRDACERLASTQPLNPFCSAQYASARSRSGANVWLLGVREGSELIGGCVAYLSAGRLNRSLEIDSMPAASDLFTEGLVSFCEEQRISRLSLNTFASPPGSSIARFSGEKSRVQRREFLLDLTQSDLRAGLSSNHKRRVKAAEKAGVSVRPADGATGISEHLRLIGATFERRQERGEDVPEAPDPSPLEAFVETGAGRIYQACQGDCVLSSILILLSQGAGYYQSAGNSPEGMSLGASHLLVYQVAGILKSEAREQFNLGGVSEDNPGLVRFKESFGAQVVELEAAEFDVGPSWKTAVNSMASLVRRGSSTIRKLSSAKP